MAVRLLEGHCFYIKKMGVLCERWECKSYRLIFTRDENLIRHFKEERCTEGETKIIGSGSKFKHILNSPEKVFYGGNTKFCYTACQWIETHAIETGKHIHHKMCGHGVECMVNVWVLNDECKKKHQYLFWSKDMSLKLTQWINFMDVIGMGIHV